MDLNAETSTAWGMPDFSESERTELFSLLRRVCRLLSGLLDKPERDRLKELMRKDMVRNVPAKDQHGLPIALMTLRTAMLFVEKLDSDRDIILAIILYPLVRVNCIDADELQSLWGGEVSDLTSGLIAVDRFSSRNNVVNQENFRGLLLSLAKDIRVIIIMIVRNLVVMRSINHHPDQEWVRFVSFEANCLYAQLAHRLGLYYIKGELEDLSLKYTNREIYTQIARKLNETKRERDSYIAEFIAPVKSRLESAGLKFDIKGRTKSISSIWAKMRKQKIDLNGIYDLFAIRVIIDTPRELEVRDCWIAYSVITNMFTANPERMKDWVTVPKSNGYESLHTTVMGPGNRWVEVQIRTRRMDLVAEKGLAAHWRYKGVKSDSTDQWMNNVRDILETADAGPMSLMKNVKMDFYGREVFAFTPKGDLLRLPYGSTVLDFAFHIHSGLGSKCTGAIVNGRHEKISYKVKNGDTLEILTSSTQTPKQGWLQIVVTSKARNKIKQTLNEARQHKADLGKELMERRLKNRKIEMDEALLMKMIKRSGYKYVNDFYVDVAEEKVDVARFISACQREIEPRDTSSAVTTRVTAEEFQIRHDENRDEDVVVIGDRSIRGLNYKLAKCCAPIYGDDVFGFISSDGVVKIHRSDCPNASNIREHYPYRLINVRWSGVSGTQFPVTLRIVGQDDIGIVTNITSIISKEKNVSLRNISIDSDDGIFQGYLVIGLSDSQQLSHLIRKIKTVKGVKDVERS